MDEEGDDDEEENSDDEKPPKRAPREGARPPAARPSRHARSALDGEEEDEGKEDAVGDVSCGSCCMRLGPWAG